MASAPDVPFRSLMLGLKMTLTKSKETVQTLNAVFSPCFQTIVFSVELHNFIRVPVRIFKTVYQHWSPYKMKCPMTQLDHRGSPLEVHSWTLPPCHRANIQNLCKLLCKTFLLSHFNGYFSPRIFPVHLLLLSRDLGPSLLLIRMPYCQFQMFAGLLLSLLLYILLPFQTLFFL